MPYRNGIYGHRFRVRINPFVAVCLQIGHLPLRTTASTAPGISLPAMAVSMASSAYISLRESSPACSGATRCKGCAVAACRPNRSTRILVSVSYFVCYKWIFGQKNREHKQCGRCRMRQGRVCSSVLLFFCLKPGEISVCSVVNLPIVILWPGKRLPLSSPSRASAGAPWLFRSQAPVPRPAYACHGPPVSCC